MLLIQREASAVINLKAGSHCPFLEPFRNVSVDTLPWSLIQLLLMNCQRNPKPCYYMFVSKCIRSLPMNKQMKPCAPARNRRLWMKPGEASLQRQGKNRLHVVPHRYDASHGLEKTQGIMLLRWPLNQFTSSLHLTHLYHEEEGLNRFAIFLQYMLARSYDSSPGGWGAESMTEGFGTPEPRHRVLQELTKGQNRDLLEQGVISLPAKCWWPYLERLQHSWKRC